MRLSLQSDGVIREPDLHDGLLDGIRLLPDSALRLEGRTVAGVGIVLLVPRLSRLRADNFLEGNIIFEASAYEGPACPRDALRAVFGYEGEGAEEQLAQQAERVAQGGMALLTITSSYGCELLALFGGRIRDIEVTLSSGGRDPGPV